MPPQIKLQSSWYWKRREEGIELGSILAGRSFLMKAEPEFLVALLERLDNGATLAELAQATGRPLPIIRSAVEKLTGLGCLLSITSGDSFSEDRYSSQTKFFQLYETQENTAKAMNDRLRSKTILVAGVGGFGSFVLVTLLRMGIGKVIAVDPDRVELSNLSRQLLFGEKDIGKLKVDACADSARWHHPGIVFEGVAKEIRSAADLVPHLDGVDLVFNCFGYYPNPGLLGVTEASGRAGIPCLTYGGSWVGPLTVPGESPCYECVVSEPEIKRVVEHSFGTKFHRRSADGGHFCARIATTSSLAAWEGARFLSQMDEAPSSKGVIMLDLNRYRAPLFLTVPRKLGCSLCGKWKSKWS